MSHPSTHVEASKTTTPSSETWSHQVFGEQNFWSVPGLVAWWFRWTSPADAPAGASFQQRDLVRRGRIASAIMLFLVLVLLGVAAIGFFGPNKQIFFTALLVWATIGVCVVLNRRKHVNLVGVLLCLSVNAGMYLSILRAPGGLGIDDKDILYLLVFVDLFVGAILPASWIWIPLLLNLAFSTYELTLAPHTPALEFLLQTSRFTILTRVFQIHIFVSGVLWILNTSARATIQRANQAEETARLQRDMALLHAERDQEAQQLQQAIHDLESTLAQVAKGHLLARVPSQHGGRFWALGGMLNGLLNRYQRAIQDAREVEKLRMAVYQHKPSHQIAQRLTEEQTLIQEAIERAQRERRPFIVPEAVTLLEPFFHQLQGHMLVPVAIEKQQHLQRVVPASRPLSVVPFQSMPKEVSHD